MSIWREHVFAARGGMRVAVALIRTDRRAGEFKAALAWILKQARAARGEIEVGSPCL